MEDEVVALLYNNLGARVVRMKKAYSFKLIDMSSISSSSNPF